MRFVALGISCVLLLAAAAVPAAAAERAIDKEVVVAAPLAAVWQSWTTKAGIEGFFSPEAEIDARVGGAFHIHMDPLAEPGMKGADEMRYLALQPKKMLSFDWNAPPSLPQLLAEQMGETSSASLTRRVCQGRSPAGQGDAGQPRGEPPGTASARR